MLVFWTAAINEGYNGVDSIKHGHDSKLAWTLLQKLFGCEGVAVEDVTRVTRGQVTILTPEAEDTYILCLIID